MKRVVVLTAVALGVSAAPAQADMFDTAFGRFGLASAPLETGAGNGDHFNVVANAPGGGYYTAGYVIKAASGNQQTAVAKLTPTGALDGTFGVGGVALVDHDVTANNLEQGRGIVVQSDGKIVTVSYAGTAAADSDIYVSRFTSGGVIDGTFGLGGTRKIELSTVAGGDQAWGLVRRPDDRLVVVASRGVQADGRTDRDYNFIGLTANGDLDPTWGGGDGIATPPRATTASGGTNYELTENPRGGTIQADGKILTAGYASGVAATPTAAVTRPFIYRLLADGTPDPSFGTNGLASYDLNGTTAPNTSESYMLAQQSDGKIVSVGYGITGTTANNNLLVARLTTDGKLDTTFGTNGVFSYDAGPADRARNVVVTADDKIVVVGSVDTGGGALNGLVIRLTKDGARDASFGNDGVVSADFGGTTDALFGAALAPDGKTAVAVGWSGSATANDDSVATRLSFSPAVAPEVVTNTVEKVVTNTVLQTVPAPVAKPAAPKASTTIKRSSKRLSGVVDNPKNVGKVLLRLTRGTGSKCRAYVPTAGTFSGRSCTSGKGFAVAYADGTWTLNLAKKLTKGSYRVEVVAYALDGAAQSSPSKAKFTVS